MDTLQATFCKEGYDFTLENAKDLKKAANLSADNNLFGVACSLNILAAEDGIKAINLIMKYYGFEGENTDFKKLFISHPVKHNIIAEFSEEFIPVIEIIYVENWFFNYVYDLIHRRVKTLPEEYDQEKLLKDFEPFLELIRHQMNKSKDLINFEEAKMYWSKANTNKNNGLYVNFHEDRWLVPQKFTYSNFAEANKHAIRIIDCAEKMVEVCELVNALKNDPSKVIWPKHLKHIPS